MSLRFLHSKSPQITSSVEEGHPLLFRLEQSESRRCLKSRPPPRQARNLRRMGAGLRKSSLQRLLLREKKHIAPSPLSVAFALGSGHLPIVPIAGAPLSKMPFTTKDASTIYHLRAGAVGSLGVYPQICDTRESPLDRGGLVVSLWEALFVASQKWIPFPTALVSNLLPAALAEARLHFAHEELVSRKVLRP